MTPTLQLAVGAVGADEMTHGGLANAVGLGDHLLAHGSRRPRGGHHQDADACADAPHGPNQPARLGGAP